MSVKSEAVRALDTQLDFINYYKSKEGRNSVVYFISSLVEKGNLPVQPSVDPNEYTAMTGLRIVQELQDQLGVASTYYLTEEMFDVNFQAASKIPSITFRQDDLPSDSGFMMLPEPLVTIDVRGDRMSSRAMAWWKSEIRIPAKQDDETKLIITPCLMFCLFSNKQDWEVDDTMLKLRKNDPAMWARWPQWQLCHWTYLLFDRSVAEVVGQPGTIVQLNVETMSPEDEESLREERQRNLLGPGDVVPNVTMTTDLEGTQTGSFYAFLRSFFLLVRQKIAVTTNQHPDRAGLRRWASAGLPPEYGQIEIVTLRKRRPSNTHEIEGDSENWVDWSHRWLVGGHWHPYWVGSGNDRHLEDRWVETYEKGPLDKPLIIKDKVFVWKR